MCLTSTTSKLSSPEGVLIFISSSTNLPTNPFELVEMIRRQNSMIDATDPSDAIDDALKSFNSLEENLEI